MAPSHDLPSPEVSQQIALEERARFLVAEVMGDPEAVAAIRAGLRAEQGGQMVKLSDLQRKYSA